MASKRLIIGALLLIFLRMILLFQILPLSGVLLAYAMEAGLIL